MITINVDQLRQSAEVVRKRGLEAKAQALKEYRSRILAMYAELLRVSPQYSGDLVSNWDIQVEGAPERAYVEHPDKDQFGPFSGATPHHAGDEGEAFRSAYARGVNRLRYISYYGQPVYFVNPTILDLESPLIVGPDGVEQMRDGVVIQAWASISSYLQERYA